MQIQCCGNILLPTSVGSPKVADECFDFDCPKCGKHYALDVTKGETYDKQLAAHNERVIANGTASPEQRTTSQIVEAATDDQIRCVLEALDGDGGCDNSTVFRATRDKNDIVAVLSRMSNAKIVNGVKIGEYAGKVRIRMWQE